MSGEGDFKPFDSGRVPRYQEIATFMRAARAAIAPPLEVALLGVPLDLGATYRVGARHGPAAVREASRLIRQVNPSTGVAPFQLCKVADVGDAPTDPLDVVRSVALIQEFCEASPRSAPRRSRWAATTRCRCRCCARSRKRVRSG